MTMRDASWSRASCELGEESLRTGSFFSSKGFIWIWMQPSFSSLPMTGSAAILK